MSKSDLFALYLVFCSEKLEKVVRYSVFLVLSTEYLSWSNTFSNVFWLIEQIQLRSVGLFFGYQDRFILCYFKVRYSSPMKKFNWQLELSFSDYYLYYGSSEY